MDGIQHAPGTPRDVPETGTDWERLRTMTDEDIAAAVAKNPDAAPIRSYQEIMTRYRLVPPRNAKR